MSTSPVAPQVSEKPSLIRLLAYSLQIVGQFFPMVYPIFGYFLLAAFLMPRGVANFEHWGWWTVYAGVFLIMFLFKAGWNTTMFEACQSWMRHMGIIKRPGIGLSGQTFTPTIPSFFESFGILKYFFPGVGVYGPDYLVGCLIETTLLTLPLAIAAGITYQFIGIPMHYFNGASRLIQESIQTGQPLAQGQVWKLVNSLSANEIDQLFYGSVLILGALFIAMLTQLFLLYWEPIVRRDNCNAFQAIWRSLKTVAQRPFTSFGIWLYFNASFIFLALLMGMNDWIAIIANFINIIFIALMGCYLYLYMHFHVSPVIEEPPPPSSPRDSDDDY